MSCVRTEAVTMKLAQIIPEKGDRARVRYPELQAKYIRVIRQDDGSVVAATIGRSGGNFGCTLYMDQREDWEVV